MKVVPFLLVCMFSNVVLAELFVYDNKYKQIQVGVSSKNDVIASNGKPIRKSIAGVNMKFHYQGFHVTFQNDTVNTIIIFNPEYLDANGIKVGFSDVVLEAVMNSKVKNNYLVDPDKGIIYWFENREVSKIVLAYKLKLNN